jgi:tRNA(His) guanylyltransferase
LRQSGRRVTPYSFTQSGEIRLLFGPDEGGFGLKLRKLLSVLSGEASARFSLLLGAMAVFDCRVSQLPSVELVIDYFRWRAEDARRNALNAHCYWLLRGQGRDAGQANEALSGLSTSAKNELLFRGGINFNDLPSWQKRGSGLYWEEFERPGENPVTGERVSARRRRICHDLELPARDAYSAFLRGWMRPTTGD